MSTGICFFLSNIDDEQILNSKIYDKGSEKDFMIGYRKLNTNTPLFFRTTGNAKFGADSRKIPKGEKCYKTNVRPVMLYGTKWWRTTSEHTEGSVAEIHMLR